MFSFPVLSIRSKLAVAFGTLLLLQMAIAGLGLVELRSLNGVVSALTETWLPKIEKLETIKRLALAESLLAARRAIETDPKQQKAIDSRIDTTRWAIRSTRAAYSNMPLSDDERGRFVEFEALWSRHEAAGAGAVALPSDSLPPSADGDLQLLSQRAFDSAIAVLDDLIVLSRLKSSEITVQTQAAYALYRRLIAAAALLGTVCAAAAIGWTIIRISVPLQHVSRAMKLLTAGVVGASDIPNDGRKDEIGDLLSAYSGYRESQIERGRLAEIAAIEHSRLQAAVSNMPIGLAMFDANSRLIISNDRYAEMYGLPEECLTKGAHLAEILAAILKPSSIPQEERDRIVGEFTQRAYRKEPSFDTYELFDGRTMNITFQPMKEGGWVEVHEDISERRRNQAQIEYMAKHDALTDLPNRVLLSERADEALRLLRRDETLGVLCLDLDRFKNVNDTLGHPAGDALLKMVANRLREMVRETDTVARLGGDEFVVIQAPCSNPEDTIVLAQRIIERIGEAYDIDGREVVIGVSIGISTSPTDGREIEQLLKKGDIALYRAKSDGRGTFRFFEPEMDAWVQSRRILELDMRRALAKGEFRLDYQPIVHLETDTVTSFEALIRWTHSERGEIAPTEFIPIAEEIGLIVPIGDWVLKQACLDAVGWPDGMVVAVNVSPAQFRSPAFLGSVLSALAVSKLPAERLEIEITEGVLMSNYDSTLALLHQLRARGVRVAMDDFGTGYSSLSYLRSFPFDRIKIDSSFIRNIVEDRNSMAIIRATAGLGVSLGMATTAEGVETAEQLKRVREEGCSDVQGFYFSKAIPLADVIPFLAARKKTGQSKRRSEHRLVS